MQHGRKGATQLLDSDAHRGELRVDAQRRLEDQPGGKRMLDSQFKCNTEVGSEYLDRGSVAEAFSRRGVEVPDYIIDIVLLCHKICPILGA
jgi:hypothetical protein